ncbi:thiamine phosphate synthase [Streptomyces sp. RB6PN25]|uniref:Thiamine-phosphate synthase n=1 Tax=Streptomyces humicola TaxID=2953240 RepID=A0ABT1PV55_9ACTN|nr:thiamine phosphate synthase [Streptomyces humicola]MCQ4081540.1 thiamine phosphate synthase [Streptomyces humicola]
MTADVAAGSTGTATATARQRRAKLAEARVYLCTDARKRQGDLAEFLDAVLAGGAAGGVDIVQLREKGLEAREELEHLEVLAAACRKHGKLLAVNDRADVAHAAGADVLHLGQGDLPVPAARAIVGDEVVIGRSCHAESEAAAAAAEPGADYFCTGPVWPTPTKPGRHAPGLPLVEYAAGLGTDRPWFAIGGIDLSNVGRVLAAGARRIVVVRAITEADDPGEAAARLAEIVRNVDERRANI